MTTVSIQLSDKALETLKFFANKKGTSIEKAIEDSVQRYVLDEVSELEHLRAAAAKVVGQYGQDEGNLSDEDFEILTDFLLKDDKELLKRLS
ncbi:MAG: hypothetical protein AAF789_14200 [Bacteroidota bacterium]